MLIAPAYACLYTVTGDGQWLEYADAMHRTCVINSNVTTSAASNSTSWSSGCRNT